MRFRSVVLMSAICVALAPAALAQADSQQQQPSAPNCPELASALTAVINNDVRLRDWANLAHYREANLSLAAPQKGETRVVFMGDSITDAWQRPQYKFFPGKPYVDRGISGQTTPQMLLRFRPDVIRLKPMAVVILAGTNDIAGNTGPMTDEEIAGNIASMCELARANNIRVILASVLPVSNYHNTAAPQTDRRPMARIQAINTWMKAYAAAQGHTYLDYFSALIDSSGLLREELSTDDLHPNAKGYAIMAPLAQAAIESALKLP